MSYNCIRIERERDGYEVHVTDPAIVAANKAHDTASGKNSMVSEWKDPQVEYKFETKEQVLAFIEKAMDIALPKEKDEFSSTFDKLAKDALKDG